MPPVSNGYLNPGAGDSGASDTVGAATGPTFEGAASRVDSQGQQSADMSNPYAPIALQSALMAESQQADQQQNQQNTSSPGLNRMTTPPASQSQAGSQDVWVTVPVDKVEVGASGRGTMTPVYANTKGFRSPSKGNNIPPASTTGNRGVPAPPPQTGGQQ